MNTLLEQLRAILDAMVSDVMTWTPKIIVGVLLLLLAIGLAKIIERLLRSILVRLHFDSMTARIGIDKMLLKIGVRQSINEFVPRVIYFLLLFLFAKTAADALNLSAISQAIGAVMAYLPNVVAALLILIVGSAAAQFIGTAVATAARNSGAGFATSLGRFVTGLLLYVLIVMALSQLGIDTEIIRLFTIASLAGFALAFGLSFGLGSRDVTRNILAGFYARRTLRIGDELEIAGEKGTLISITATQTILRQGKRTVAVANSRHLDEVAKQ